MIFDIHIITDIIALQILLHLLPFLLDGGYVCQIRGGCHGRNPVEFGRNLRNPLKFVQFPAELARERRAKKVEP